jgi:thiamine biosynthesis lipoprotein
MKKLLFLLIAVFLVVSCSKKDSYHFHSGVAEGTTFHIKYRYDKDLSEQIDSLLNYFEGVLSTYRDTSIISKFNKLEGDTFIFHNELFADMIKKSFEVYKKTEGAFDITVATLVNAWGFGFDTIANVDSAKIDSILEFTGMDKIELIGDTMLIKKDSRIMIDDNAIAKGQSVDFVSKYFDSLGIKDYLVEIGGEIRVKGKNPKGSDWVIGIDKPIDGSTEWDRELEASIYLTNKAIATSGNYRKFYVKEGKKYAHTIDPVTGYPVQHSLLSTTVIFDDCMTADAYATAFMVMGYKKSRDFVLSHKGFEVMFIYDENGKFKVFATNDFKKRIRKNQN